MNKHSSNLLTLMLAAGVYVCYSAQKGKGVFNKPRFKKQHEAISRYIETAHNGAHYDPIYAAGSGWATTIHTLDNRRIALYIIKNDHPDEKGYIFTEREI